MMTDPIANMIAAIKNAQMVLKPSTVVPASKMKKALLKVLVDEGYIAGYEDTKCAKGHPAIKITLKYFEGEAVIKQIKRISKPGRRVYAQLDKMPKVFNGLGIIVVSTSKGIMTEFDARQQKIGGELLCSVF
jgi:small subunit ribosomal protein S8